MIEAYVLIHVEPGTTPAVLAAVSRVSGVASADGLAGPYDVIARLKARNLDELATIVTTEIQAAGGVMRTLVCVVPGSEDGS
ncbi:MAG: Lrp/AsnC ligand binding domain-containing protein [Actinomycetota bacterium]